MELRETTSKSIEKFGADAQIVVCMEELCELASVIAKYPRYKDKDKAIEKTREKVLDEYCDVIICLDTIAQVFGFTDENIQPHLKAKVERVNRWLNSEESSMEVTTVDRAVIEDKPCKTCGAYNDPDYKICHACETAYAKDGTKPYYKENKET